MLNSRIFRRIRVIVSIALAAANLLNSFSTAQASAVPACNFQTSTYFVDSATAYEQVTFTDTSTSTSGGCNWSVPAGVSSVDILIVGGGGGGGGGVIGSDYYENSSPASESRGGGGGGGGGSVIELRGQNISGAINVKVGTGGTGGSQSFDNESDYCRFLLGDTPTASPVITDCYSAVSGSNGGSTSITYGGVTKTAIGGNGGGVASAPGNGGVNAGGDGGSTLNISGATIPGGVNDWEGAGGGAGAGGTPADGLDIGGAGGKGGFGGDGFFSPTFKKYFGGGGGGGGTPGDGSSGYSGIGGVGGGGKGAININGQETATAGLDGLGGGGGGGAGSAFDTGGNSEPTSGADGGSGVVIIRYLKTPTPPRVSHTITFDTSTATSGDMLPQISDSATNIVSNNLSRDGYTFAGWSTSISGQVEYLDQANYNFETNTVLYPVWQSNDVPPSYSVTFHINDGSSPELTQVQRSTNAHRLVANVFTRDGFTFLGWALTPEGIASLADGAFWQFRSNQELYAKWFKDIECVHEYSGATNDIYGTAIADTLTAYHYVALTCANTDWTVPSGVHNVDYLVAGGGGGGSFQVGGGGGGGGIDTGTTSVSSGFVFNAFVGRGGLGQIWRSTDPASDGESTTVLIKNSSGSVVSSINVEGGKAALFLKDVDSECDGVNLGGLPGNNGGGGGSGFEFHFNSWFGCGTGAPNFIVAQPGTVGISSQISGANHIYGSGGGGGGYQTDGSDFVYIKGGNGGEFSGGNGGDDSSPGLQGMPFAGGGGGGGGWHASGGSGAAGVVLLRYLVEDSFTVTYSATTKTGGSTPTDTTTYFVNDTATVLSEGSLEKSGYTFAHWNTSSTDTGTVFSPGDTLTVTSNVTLYAIWTEDPPGGGTPAATKTMVQASSAELTNSGKIAIGQPLTETATVTLASDDSTLAAGSGNVEFKYQNPYGIWTTIPGCENVAVVGKYATCTWTPSATLLGTQYVRLYADFIPSSSIYYLASDDATGEYTTPRFFKSIPTTTTLALASSNLSSNHKLLSGESVVATAQVKDDSNNLINATGATVRFDFIDSAGVVQQIPGCVSVSTSSGNATCSFTPSIDGIFANGPFTFYATLVQNASSYVPSADHTIPIEVTAPPAPPAPPAPTPTPQYPGVTWSPQDLVEGNAIDSTHQLNAMFSVPGKAVYSVTEGFVPSVGNTTITVTFTPTDTTNYYVISTSRIIHVTSAPTSTPTPSPSPSQSPSPSASPMTSSSPTSKPTPSPTPTATKKPQSMKTIALTLVGTVYFNNNEYFIDATDIATIKGVADQLKKTPYKEVLVKGNTDIKKGVDNVWLSKARAEAVANTLAKYLKVPNLIRAWYASSMPVAIGLDKASLAKNRRVEIYALEEVDATVAPTPSPSASKSAGKLVLNPVTFNRNEYFLSAQARKDLVTDVQNLFKAGCRNVALVGTEDGTRGGLPNMGLLRAKAVRDFMKSLNPALTFDSLKKAISINREVRISCSH
jgi:uncharacterized repeat protein (TIGR02543 family)